MRVHNRLARLERQLIRGEGGRRACQDRRRVVLIETEQMADGTVVLRDPQPEPCAVCGEVPEQIIEVMLTTVTRRDEIVHGN
jgi:hypothetical protein